MIRIAHSKLLSHFVNITILSNEEAIELSKEEFSKLNRIIRSKLTKINNEDLHFDEEQLEKPHIKTN